TGRLCPINSAVGSIAAQEVIKGDSRFSAQACVFGDDAQRRMMSLKYLVVGAGAIGCEFLKNLAMMGIGAGGGSIYVTDESKVEKCHLNSHFLFRAKDVGCPKAAATAESLLVMNPEVHMVSHEFRVGEELGALYDESFFDDLHGVASTLENPKA
ncbi:hypothetical protein MTO96_045992, partial [Rhipicephalus appendiculatus]